MRRLRECWPLLCVLGSALAQAGPTVADCYSPATGAAQVSSACAGYEKLSTLYAQPVRAELPDSRALDVILAELGHVEQPRSLWQFFQGWLDERLGDLWKLLPELPNPFREVNLKWPAGLPQPLLWALQALLAAAVLFGIVALWRALRGQAPVALQRALAVLQLQGATTRKAVEISATDLEAAPAAQRPRILLAILLRALRSAARLDADGVLSHRQLGAAAREVTPPQRGAIEGIARLAERVTYSKFVPDEAELAQATQSVYTLVGEVSR